MTRMTDRTTTICPLIFDVGGIKTSSSVFTKDFLNLNQRTYLQGVFIIITCLTTVSFIRGGGALGYSVRLASGRLGVRIPAAIYLSRTNR